jgi:hypothetical protein
MGKHVRRSLPAFLLTTAVPLIPALALFTVPHPPSSACGPPKCLAFSAGANSFHIPDSRAAPRAVQVNRTALIADMVHEGTR